MINIHYNGGRLGNRLIQLSCAVALSHKFKQNIINGMQQDIVNIPLINKVQYTKRISVNDNNICEIFSQENLNFDIDLHGFLQKECCIQQFIRYNHFIETDMIDATFMHVRLGDLIRLNKVIPFEYYDEAIKSMNHNHIILSSDTPDHEIIQKLLKKYDISMFIGDEYATIVKGASCRQKILSQGTFSWWIGFLNNDKTNITTYPSLSKYKPFHEDIFTNRNWMSI